jgi:hypothetical protein
MLVSPTVFREGAYRFFFFSREEPRMHIHVGSSEGEAKLWLEPRIELAENHGLPTHEITTITRIVGERADEIAAAWRQHFGS